MIDDVVAPLKTEITLLQERVQVIENIGGSSSDNPQTNKVVKDLQNALENWTQHYVVLLLLDGQKALMRKTGLA